MPNVLAVCPINLPVGVKYTGGAIYNADEIAQRWQQMYPEGQYFITWWSVHGAKKYVSMSWDGGDPANLPWADIVNALGSIAKPAQPGDLPSNLGGNNGVPELERTAPVAEAGNIEPAPADDADRGTEGAPVAGEEEWNGGAGETEIA